MVTQSMLEKIAKQIAIKTAALDAHYCAKFPGVYVPGSLDPVSDASGHGKQGKMVCPGCGTHVPRYSSDFHTFKACEGCKAGLKTAERDFLRSPEGRKALAAAMAAK